MRHLQCDDCGRQYSETEALSTCGECGGLLEAQYDFEAVAQDHRRGLFPRRGKSLWRWASLLPVREDRNIVSLGEGDTPLIGSPKLANVLGVGSLYFKNDSLCPTGSYKDRGYSVAVSKAKELGIRRAITYTSGNAGASFAAYSARAEMDALILVKAWSSPGKIAMIRIFGHPVVKLEFTSYEEVTRLLEFAAQELKMYQFVNFLNPYRHEGNKTYAYEFWHELDGRIPDWVIHPTSTGGGLWGTWKGFNELKELGLTDSLPRMVAAQPDAVAPIVRAFEKRLPYALPFGDPKGSVAQSIGSNAPIGQAKRVLKALYNSHGCAVSVPDKEILEGVKLLASEGIFAEPAGGLTIAALRRLVEQGVVKSHETAICVVTGSGLKQPEIVEMMLGKNIETIPAEPSAFTRIVHRAWGLH